jgi:hypothetical protein
MYYSASKNLVKREAFLPPSRRADVSLLRHFYTNDNFCKMNFAKLKIGDSKYCGIATFYKYHVNEILESISNNDKIEVRINATPLDRKGNYIQGHPVYKNSGGLPMHADMVYETPIVKGEPQTRHRIFANNLAKISNYFNDPFPDSTSWSGEKLNWTKK